jgi:type II secretory pathway pseudopilin PulG
VERYLAEGVEAGDLDEAPVVLSRAELERLRAAATPAAREGVGLSPVDATLTIPEGDAPVELRIRRTAQASPGQAIPICSADAALSSARVRHPGGDWSTPVLRRRKDGVRVLHATREGQLELELVLNVQRRGASLQVPSWPGPGGVVHVEGQTIQLDGDQGATIRAGRALAVSSGKGFRARVAAVTAARPTKSPTTPVRKSPARPVAAWEVLAEPEADHVLVRAGLALTQPGVGSIELRLRLPEGTRVRHVEGAPVAGWSLAADGAIVVRLTRALQGRASLDVVYDVALPPGGGAAEIAIPRVEGALRERGFLAVAPRAPVEVDAHDAKRHELVPVEADALPQGLTRRALAPVLAAYRAVAPGARLVLPITPLQAAARTTLVVHRVNGLTVMTRRQDGGEAGPLTRTSKLVMHVQNASHRYLDLTLPEGSEILACAVARRPVAPLRDPDRPGRLRIPIVRSGPASGGLAPVPVQVSYRVEAGAGEDAGAVAVPLPVIHAPVVETDWKVYTPEDMHVLGFSGDLRGGAPPPRFAPVELTSLFLEEVVEPLLWTGLVLLMLAGLVALLRSSSLRDAARAFLSAIVSRAFMLLAVVAVIGVLAAIAVPNFQAARRRANDRACFANQKTLAGALEMYNLDFNTNIQDLATVRGELEGNGYLQSYPRCPGYGGQRDPYYLDAVSGNGVACRNHGSITRVENPSYRATSMEPLASRPEGTRTTPVDVAIPSEGGEALLVRGFLPAGRPTAVRLSFLEREALGRRQLLAQVTGAVLAGLLLVMGARAGAMLVGLLLLGGALVLDGVAPPLATAWLSGGAGATMALAALGLLSRLPELISRLLTRQAVPLAAALLTVGLGTASAGEPKPVEVLRREAPGADEVLMSPATYWSLRQASRPEVAPDPRRRLRVEVEREGRVAVARMRLEVLPGEEWIPLMPAKGGNLDEVRHGRVAWPLEQRGGTWYAAPLPDGGVLELRTSSPVTLEPRGARAKLAVPRAAEATLAVAAGGERVLVDGQVWGGVRAVVPGQAVEVLWEKSAPRTRRVSPVAARTDVTASSSYLVEVGERDARSWARISLGIRGAPTDRVTLSLPDGWTALELTGDELADWEAQADGTVEVLWSHPRRGTVAVSGLFELDRPEPGRLALALPYVRGAAGENRRLAVAAPPARILELESPAREEPRTTRPEPLAGFGPAELRDVQAYASLPGSAGHEVVPVRIRALEAVTVQESRVDVARLSGVLTRDAQMLLEGTYSVKNARNQFLRVWIPEGSHLYTARVAGATVRAATDDSGALLLPLARSRVVDGSLEPPSGPPRGQPAGHAHGARGSAPRGDQGQRERRRRGPARRVHRGPAPGAAGGRGGRGRHRRGRPPPLLPGADPHPGRGRGHRGAPGPRGPRTPAAPGWLRRRVPGGAGGAGPAPRWVEPAATPRRRGWPGGAGAERGQHAALALAGGVRRRGRRGCLGPARRGRRLGGAAAGSVAAGEDQARLLRGIELVRVRSPGQQDVDDLALARLHRRLERRLALGVPDVDRGAEVQELVHQSDHPRRGCGGELVGLQGLHGAQVAGAATRPAAWLAHLRAHYGVGAGLRPGGLEEGQGLRGVLGRWRGGLPARPGFGFGLGLGLGRRLGPGRRGGRRRGRRRLHHRVPSDAPLEPWLRRGLRRRGLARRGGSPGGRRLRGRLDLRDLGSLARVIPQDLVQGAGQSGVLLAPLGPQGLP